MQAHYIGEKSKNKYDSDALIEKINNRIAAAINSDEMIIYVKQVGRRGKNALRFGFCRGVIRSIGFDC